MTGHSATFQSSPTAAMSDRLVAAFVLSSCLNDLSEFVDHIEVFGSVARGTATEESDLDLIVCTSEPSLSDLWFASCVNDLDKSGDDFDYDLSMPQAASRRSEALALLGVDSYQLDCHCYLDLSRVDMFLFPADWRDQLEELQARGHHIDPHFMRNIAADAHRVDLESGELLPPK